MKFLIVDDDPAVLDLLTVILIGHGYEDVVRAESGVRALQLLHSSASPFDCVLLDIQMPEMDGITLCREIRKYPGYSSTPIVMLTAMRQEHYITRAFAAGATDYTVKPFDVFELMERIRVAKILSDPEALRTLSSSTAENAPLPVYTDALLTRQALDNFTRACSEQKSLRPAAIAFHVPLSTGLSNIAIASAMAETMRQSQVFSTDLEDGNFVSVCDQSSTISEAGLQGCLEVQLSEHGGILQGIEEGVRLGKWSYRKPYERAKDVSFIDRAIFNKNLGIQTKPKSAERSFLRRLLAVD